MEQNFSAPTNDQKINEAKQFGLAHLQMMQVGGNIDREKDLVKDLLADLELHKISPEKFKETIQALFESRDEI